MRYFKKLLQVVFSTLITDILLFSATWNHTTIGGAPTSTRPVICSDHMSNLHVAWTSDDNIGAFIQYATNQSGSWCYQQQITGNTSNQIYSPSITTDQQGFAYIVYRYYSSWFEPRYVTNHNITSNYWNLVQSWDDGHYHECAIEVDSKYQTHVFAQEDSYGSNIYYQNLDVDNNVVIYNITSFFSTTIDKDDILHFVGYNADGVFYTFYNGNSWSELDTIDQANARGYQPSITCDVNNVLHVVYASNGGIYYLNNAGGDWSTPELITDSGIFPNVVADENGKAHVAFHTGSNNGGIYYTNNINGTWLASEMIAIINTDLSPETEDAAHVESKIALDPKSNTVNIVYISNGNEVILAQTTDFNLRSSKSCDVNSSLVSLVPVPPDIDTVSTSSGGSLNMLQFTIADNGGDGLATKMKELILQRGPGMSADLCFNDVFAQVTLSGTDGTNLDGTIYASKIIFGSLANVWKEIPENSAYDFTVSATLKQPLLNVDGKTVQMKVNGLYDIITDSGSSCFDYNCVNVISDTVLFQVVPDHYQFVGLGNDFFGENLVEGWFLQLKIVDANGVTATSVEGIDVTLSAVQLDGITPTVKALESTESLTKTFTDGVAQWSNLTYPDSGQFRILATCSQLTGASDTITIFPFSNTLLIGQSDENMSDVLTKLNIDHDFYSTSNYKYPDSTNLQNYTTLILDHPYSIASYFDTTTIKKFLESGTTNNRKNIIAIGDNGLGYQANTDFANNYFGGRILNWYQHDATTIQGINEDPVTDGLSLNIVAGFTNIITPNDNLSIIPVILTFPQTEYIVGTKVETDRYRTVFISVNFVDISANAQRDSLISKIIQWFQSSSSPQIYGPELSELPDIEMTEDVLYKMTLCDWYPYVEDSDTPDEELAWNVVDGMHVTASVQSDTLFLTPAANYFGPDSITVIVSDGSCPDTGTVHLNVESINDPPLAFNLLSPENGAQFADTAEVVFEWQAAPDPEDQPVFYEIRFSTESYDTSIACGNQSELIVNLDYTTCPIGTDIYWSVIAFDEEDTTLASNNPFSFGIIPTLLTNSEGLPLPDRFVLFPNYPNPFNSTTAICYGLPEESQVMVRISDINGRQIQTLVRKTQPAGFYTIHWNAANISSGIYFIQIIAGDFQQIRKCILMK